MQADFRQIALQPLIPQAKSSRLLGKTTLLSRVRRLLLAATTCFAYWVLSGILDLFDHPALLDDKED
jgi:hypothetical protein